MKHALASACLSTLLAAGGLVGSTAVPAAASDIKFIVNGMPVTSYDIQRRAAFLRLQHKKGDLNKLAGDEMVTQALRNQEAKRLNINITPQAVDAAYDRFAKSNKMTVEQLSTVMEKSGVTAGHFKEFIRAQMSWNQAISARYSAKAKQTSQRDAVQQMFKQGGSKPSATEYMLQQVIFVVPAADRAARLSQRKAQAESMRQRFTGCGTTRQFAKGLIDVTVRDLGRTLAPALPPLWADAVKVTKPGTATPVKETERGVEFIGVCSTREVSDDRVAQVLAQAQDTQGDKKADELSEQYMADLRKRAQITAR